MVETATSKTGPELMDEAASEPTLDELNRRDPATMKEDDYVQLVKALRADRAWFNAREAKRQAKAEGIDVDDAPATGADSV